MTPRQLTAQEASDTLNISVRQLDNLCRAGKLTPTYPKGGGLGSPKSFDEAQILAYLEIKDTKINMADLASIARQAYASSRSTQRQLQQVMYFLGLDLPFLSTQPADVMRMYLKVEDAIEEPDTSAESILEWGRFFYGIGDEYLRLIEQLLEDPEPWSKLIELANTLYQKAPRERFNEEKDLASAYGFLRAGRRNLLNVVYFYIRNSHGARIAEEAFPSDFGDYTDKIINLAFPDQD